MLFRRLREFRKKTQDQYIKDHREQMEPWKKQVLKLHEQSGFLFYYENCELDQPDGSRLVIFGELAKDESIVFSLPLYLYDGQGKLLGEGLLLSDPTVKEEKRRGFLRFRKQEMKLGLTSLFGKKFPSHDQREDKKVLGLFFRQVSLISDVKM